MRARLPAPPAAAAQRATGRGSPAPARALPGFVEHQDIPQLIRALGYALSNEDLNTRLADAGIGETLEFEEYLLLVKALGKRPDRQVEIRELKEAIAMVTKSKDTVSESARNAPRPPPPAALTGPRSRVADVEDLARIMGVVGTNAGEELTDEEVEDFKQQMGGRDEMGIDEFVQMLVDC